ncbi:MAG: alkaline phosphatase family protein [Acidobacteriota bacterium]
MDGSSALPRFLLPLATALVVLLGCGADTTSTADDTSRSRLVVIGIDGLSWAMADPLIERGEMPHLAALAERGWRADMETVEPLFSPPNWTSLATGRYPNVHGINSFYADRRHVQVPTTWERLAAAGRRVGVYDVLVTWPPKALPDGVVIPGWLRRDDAVWPADLTARMDGRPPWAYDVLIMGDLDETVAENEAELANKPGDAVRLVETFDLDVLFVSFYAVDVTSHRFQHVANPEAFDPRIPFEPRFDGILEDVVRRVDQAIGTIVDGLGPNTHVILVSDHGSAPGPSARRRWGYGVRWMLDEAGFEASTSDGTPAVDAISSWSEAVFRITEGPEAERDEATDRLAATLDAVRAPDGAPVFDVEVVRDPERVVAEVADSSKRITNMASHLPAHAFVFATLAHPDVDRFWPDGMLTVGDRSVRIGEVLHAHDFTGMHDPTAIFLATGPAISPGLPPGTISVVDVASWVLHLAGQPIPADLEGRSPAPWLDPAHLRDNPVRVVPADAVPLLPTDSDTEARRVGDDDAEIEERLRALGYVD